MTVLVRVVPPDALVAKYKELAAHKTRLMPLFEGAAEGGFGSGSLLVRRERAAGGEFVTHRLIVTNRHVVDLSSVARVRFAGAERDIEAPVVYVDPVYDLAVLSLGANADATLPDSGFELETAPAKDQQPVAASGYPGIGNTPSYQVTRGYVSNEHLDVPDGAGARPYIQHTAPIDRGSSGGPLSSDSGKLLGVNTLKVRQRENVGIAIPAAAVAEAMTAAIEHLEHNAPESGGQGALRACNAVLAALERGADGVAELERSIGARLVARDGVGSLDSLPEGEGDWAQEFVESPSNVMQHAIALRLGKEMKRSGGSQSGRDSGCVPSAPNSTGDLGFDVSSASGVKKWFFAWEQRRFKLVNAALTTKSLRGTPFGPSAQPKKWTPSLR
ncbi:MAG: serine protease [Polyangiaceae bacterium]